MQRLNGFARNLGIAARLPNNVSSTNEVYCSIQATSNMHRPIKTPTSAKKTIRLRRFLCPIITGLVFLISTATHIAAETLSPPQLRLGGDVRPLRCALDLVVVPEHSNFTGHVIIDLKLARPLSTLWLHGTGLSVDQARIETKGAKLSARVETNSNQYMGFTFERPVGPGRAWLQVFSGRELQPDL